MERETHFVTLQILESKKMNCTLLKRLPTKEDIIRSLPLSLECHRNVLQHRHEIKEILNGKDNRLLIIIGPCSAWPDEAVIEYANRLLELSCKVKHALKIVMRTYVQKSRTITGWGGAVNQPDPFAVPDIEAGIKYSRRMMLKVVEMGLPIADEALSAYNSKVFLDLLSWVAIGARSSENLEHRVFASAIDCPVGLKNPTHGSLNIGVNSVVVAQDSHVTIVDGYEAQTQGNPYAHLVLRGSGGEPNYSINHLEMTKLLFEQYKIANPAVIVDTSHSNCFINGKKDYRIQPKIVFDVIESIKSRPDIKKLIKGFMLESFLKEGSQSLESLDSVTIDRGGLSITDPCIGWNQTEETLLRLKEVYESMCQC